MTINTPYLGVVEENKDPERLGRLKVRVNAIYGDSRHVSTEALPWAIPFGLPAGGSKSSGGVSWLPEPGDQVLVMFLDGEPEKPVWTWSMQAVKQAKEYPFRKQDKAGKPDAATLTRYGHTVEISANSVIVTTSQGYSLILQNRSDPASGYVQLRTPKGQTFLLDDQLDLAQLFVNGDLQAQVMGDIDAVAANVKLEAKAGPVRILSDEGIAASSKDIAFMSEEDEIHHAGNSVTFLVEGESGTSVLAMEGGRVTVTDQKGTAVSLDGEGGMAIASQDCSVQLSSKGIELSAPGGTSVVMEDGKLTVNGTDVVINSSSVTLGKDAVSPVVIANLLALFFNAHTHSNGNNGSPTGTPIVPMMAEMVSSKTTNA